MKSPLPFEFLEHTADIRLHATGATIEELFQNAARGMMAFLFEPKILEVACNRSEAVSIDSTDLDSLLVDWLSYLLLRVTTDYRAFTNFDFRSISDTRLEAIVGSIEAEAIEDIKAVTHHELQILKRATGYEATIIFDI